jgi:carboxypeptidase C (cathepsin A)
MLVACMAGCGGGGSGDAATSSTPLPAGALGDTTPYSTAPNASLDAPVEAVAVTSHTLALGTATVAYTATAGHLNARDPQTGGDEASMFYVAYTVPAAASATRPIVFFYNGGPGSATVWLHLGSYAPRRIVTNDPSLAIPQPFQLVDNTESLIDVADLVFVDAVGSGYSEAIAPRTNQSFWSVDTDAATMRDFIARYVAVNQRAASPTYLFGESYGTTRSAILADLMLAAGMRLDGVVLQSSILDYNSNCDVFAPGQVSCEGSLPSYGEVGAWFGLTQPVPTDVDAWAQQLRSFAVTTYGPAVAAYVQTGQPAPAGLDDQLVNLTGAPLALWSANLDLDAFTFRSNVLPGQLMGRYDARVVAPAGSALSAGGDPSSTLINAPFAAAARQLFSQELLYVASANYTLLSNAIDTWNFSHDGRALPDTIPDLASAWVRKPGLRTLSLAGYHDLATPFMQTELDLARLGVQPNLATRVYAGGHMTYLDDASRVRLRADLVSLLAGGLPAPAAASARSAVGQSTEQEARAGLPSAPSLPTAAKLAPEPDRATLAQGGDPYLPPALRIRPSTPSPSGTALAAIVRRKIAERDRDVYR